MWANTTEAISLNEGTSGRTRPERSSHGRIVPRGGDALDAHKEDRRCRRVSHDMARFEVRAQRLDSVVRHPIAQKGHALMPGELARWLSTTPADRQHRRDLNAVDRNTDLAEAQVYGLARVQSRAMFTTMQVNALRMEAERIAPEGAELYAMIAVAGAVEMTNVISRMNRPGLGR